uniref:doublesex- and mab-3-related transcription factor B1-like isoform X1 n=1 Tax=Monopterus albus TaxID=43700 RepID=UPI0009B46BFC|nr:doublesex- and mab-3-related transcription factor B1-like isoform X1 [Monopterus albus]
MPLSKQIMVSAAEKPRQPKCTRCRYHGIIVPQKGHMKRCPFLKCGCCKCNLVTERTRIATLQRNLKRAENAVIRIKSQNKQQRPCDHTAVSLRNPADEGACAFSATDGDVGLSEVAEAPLDLRCKPAAGREHVAGLDSRCVLPFPSSEGWCTSFSAPYISELGQPVPLPFIHFPFGVPSYCLSSYVPCPNVMLSVPWLPPVPAGLCEDGLQGPLILPQIQQGAVHHSPPPEPGPPAESRKVFFTLQPPPLQEELMPVKHPQPPAKHEETNIAELD